MSTSSWLKVIILMFMLTACGKTLKNGSFGDDSAWKLSPEGGTPGPKIVSTGSVRGLFIGHDKSTNQDGAANSKVTQTFKCSNSNNEWCTVTFMAMCDTADGEKLKVTLSNGGNISKSGYISNIREEERKISIQACGTVTLTFEMTGGSRANLQSTAFIASVKSNCYETGVIKNLKDNNGEPLTLE